MEAVSKSNEWLEKVMPDVQDVLKEVKSKMTPSQYAQQETGRKTDGQDKAQDHNQSEGDEAQVNQDDTDSVFSDNSAQARLLQQSLNDMVEDLSEEDEEENCDELEEDESLSQ